jgi:hypothetical protein
MGTRKRRGREQGPPACDSTVLRSLRILSLNLTFLVVIKVYLSR